MVVPPANPVKFIVATLTPGYGETMSWLIVEVEAAIRGCCYDVAAASECSKLD